MRLSPSNFAKGIQLLQIYTSLTAKVVTPSQKKKFIDGVCCPEPQHGLQIARRYISKGCFFSQIRPVVGTLPPARSLLDMNVSDSRRGPTPVGSFSEPDSLIDSSNYLFGSLEGWNHYLKYLDLYRPVLKDIVPYDIMSRGMVAPRQSINDFVVGRIGLIQEPGYKLRAVANPGRVFQRVLEPLGDSIYSLIKRFPWDCTFNQMKAFPILQQALAAGRTVSSIDLTGATDYFPLSLQIDVLQYVFQRDQLTIDLFREISTSKWLMPNHGLISWNRGQPLGLYPSFGSFALTHGLLLLGLCNGEYQDQFFVLGDDVVILDTQIADEYLRVLSILGCPVSGSKTIRSANLCEFAGKIVTTAGVYPQLKWRTISDDSFVDVAKLLGPRSMGLLQNRQRKVISAIAEVPEFLGGLGWNSSGKPLEDRISSSWIFDSSLKAQPRVTGLLHERISKLMRSTLVQSGMDRLRNQGIPVSYLLPDDDLDQRSLYLTQSHLPRLVPWYMIMGKNLDLVFQLLTQDLDLPIKAVVGSSRPSQLMLWEKRLGLHSW